MELLKPLSLKFNRRLQQTEFLFDLCDRDLAKLEKLEQKIKDHHIMYCPDDKEEVNRLLSL